LTSAHSSSGPELLVVLQLLALRSFLVTLVIVFFSFVSSFVGKGEEEEEEEEKEGEG
jgi:hypothetical protein